MLATKILTYGVTIAAALFFAAWELKLKRQLTDEAMHFPRKIGDPGILNDLSERMKREHILQSLPRERLRKFRLVVGLKFLFVAMLIIEVIVLQ